MGFLMAPKIPAYNPPPSNIPDPEPEPEPTAKLDADLPQTEEESSARMKASAQAERIRRRRLGVSGLTIRPAVGDSTGLTVGT